MQISYLASLAGDYKKFISRESGKATGRAWRFAMQSFKSRFKTAFWLESFHTADNFFRNRKRQQKPKKLIKRV